MAKKKKGRKRTTIRIGNYLVIGSVAVPAVAPVVDEALSGGTNYLGAAEQGLRNATAAIRGRLATAIMVGIGRFFIKGGIPVGKYLITF